MRNVGLLIPQSHWPYKSLVLDGPTSEVGPNKGRFRNHSLPRFLRRLLSRLDHLEHLLFTDSFDFRQGYGEFRRLLSSLVLDSAGQGFRTRGLGSIEEVIGEWRRGWFVWFGGSDVSFFVRFDRFLHLDLLCVPLLLVEFGP